MLKQTILLHLTALTASAVQAVHAPPPTNGTTVYEHGYLAEGWLINRSFTTTYSEINEPVADIAFVKTIRIVANEKGSFQIYKKYKDDLTDHYAWPFLNGSYALTFLAKVRMCG